MIKTLVLFFFFFEISVLIPSRERNHQIFENTFEGFLIFVLKRWRFSPLSVDSIQVAALLTIVLFLIQSMDTVVLILFCFWIKLRKIKTVANMVYPERETGTETAFGEGDMVTDYHHIFRSVQPEVSSFHENEKETKNTIIGLERKLIALTGRVDEIAKENRNLKGIMSELQDKHRDSLAEFQEKDMECRILRKSVSRLLGRCNQQQKTIKGLRDGLKSMVLEKKQPLESSKVEAHSLGHLNGTSNICGLQDQGLSMLHESIQLSSKLLEFVKCKDPNFSQAQVQGVESNKKTMSTLLNELQSIGDQVPKELNDQLTMDAIRTELKAETLRAISLEEKLVSKESEVTQLQAELATAAQDKDSLRFEVHNQMLKKDEEIDRLQSDLQGTANELIVLKDILPKVTTERDMMWEKVKDYTENVMLLNLENGELKDKIATLEEHLRLKEAQISVLNDSIGSSSKPFDLLASPDSITDFFKEFGWNGN